MARYRRNNLRLRPINSVKNIIDSVAIGVTAAAVTTVDLGTVVNAYTGGIGEIPIGAKVSSVYLFVQAIPEAAVGVVEFLVGKKPTGVTLPVPGSSGGDPARKYILHEEKGIPGVFNNGAPPLTFRGVIRIPRGRQRMAEGDKIQLKIRGSTVYDTCVKCIYKFYQ